MALTRKASAAAKRPTKSSLQDPSAALAELAEARCQQAAVSEVLQIVSDSPGDLAAVSDAIVDRAKRLCGADGGGLLIVDGAVVRLASTRDVPEAYSDYLARERSFPLAELFGRAATDRPFLQIEDLSSTQAYRDRLPLTVATVEAGFRTSLGVPLREGNAVVGIINLIRREARPFSENHIALVQAFAAQAQIAVKNARLFNETKEALERQTATAEILRVISQALTDPQPVFERIVATAALVLRCDMAIVLVREGDVYVHTAAATPEGSITDFTPERFPIDASANFPSRAFLAKTMLHLPDWSQIDLPKHERYIHETFGLNSALYLPLLRGDECIALLVFAGRRANIFGPSEIAHAESFRDQALIAIENARLFNETQEALRQQTAASDILRVIASSHNDLQPVLDKIVETACRLCKAYDAVALLREGDQLRVAAHCGPIPITFRTQQINRGWAAGRAVIERRAIHIDDFAKQAHEYPVSAALASRGVAAGSGNMLWRANVVMPLMREGEAVGVIGLRRAEPVPFSEGQIELLKTFSDQAVIAIENVRLFEEVQAKTRDLEESLQQQTATADVLKVISQSAFHLDAVLKTLTDSARSLSGAATAAVFLRDGETLVVRAESGCNPQFL
jgi:two-component system, NtrC family, sensor kinase